VEVLRLYVEVLRLYVETLRLYAGVQLAHCWQLDESEIAGLAPFRFREEKFPGWFVEFRFAVRLYVEGRATSPLKDQNKTVTGEKIMPQYLVANYLPDDFDPSAVTEAMIEEIHALNREMLAAGARKFACGISPASNAKTLRKQPDGTVLVTDGPYTETKEHMGGFWILEAADMDEALAWARRGAISCDAAGEVRELLFYPDPQGATE
jgi:hypothetical protein